VALSSFLARSCMELPYGTHVPAGTVKYSISTESQVTDTSIEGSYHTLFDTKSNHSYMHEGMHMLVYPIGF
jgi:hypothetical protein